MFSAARLAIARRGAPRAAALVARRRGSNMPTPQSQDAKMFEGHPKWEGWEGLIGFYTACSVVLLAANYYYAPVTCINVWARNEAAARLKLKEEGFTDFEFGKHYQEAAGQTRQAAWDDFTKKSVKFSDDDDDDEEEDDDDDDDDE